MGQNHPQGSPPSRQHGQQPGREPADVDQDRGSAESGSNVPGGDGQKSAPELDERQDRPSKGNNPSSPQPGSVDTTQGDRGGTS